MFPLFLKRNLSIMPFFVCLGEGPQWKEKPYPIATGPREKLFLLYHRCALSISIYLSYSYIFVYTHPPIPPKCVSCAGCRWLPLYTNICANEVSLHFPRLTSDHFPFLSFPRSQSQVSRADDDDTHQAALSKSDVVLTFQIEVRFYTYTSDSHIKLCLFEKKNRFKRCLRQWGKKPSLWP